MPSKKSINNLKKGKRFSKTRQPKNNGRKPHLITQTLRELATEGYNAVGREEILKLWSMYLNLPEEKVKLIIEDKNRPMAERIIAKQLLGPKGYEALAELQDRVFGKSQSLVDITSLGEKLSLRIGFDNEPAVD